MANLVTEKVRDKFRERVFFSDQTTLDLKVVLGEHHVAGIANNVDYLLVAGVKVLMAFENAGTRKEVEMPFGKRFRVRDQFIDVGKVGVPRWIHQICDQEPGPGIAGFRVGNKKRIIGKNVEVTPRMLQSEGALGSRNQAMDHGGLLEPNIYLQI